MPTPLTDEEHTLWLNATNLERARFKLRWPPEHLDELGCRPADAIAAEILVTLEATGAIKIADPTSTPIPLGGRCLSAHIVEAFDKIAEAPADTESSVITLAVNQIQSRLVGRHGVLVWPNQEGVPAGHEPHSAVAHQAIWDENHTYRHWRFAFVAESA